MPARLGREHPASILYYILILAHAEPQGVSVIPIPYFLKLYSELGRDSHAYMKFLLIPCIKKTPEREFYEQYSRKQKQRVPPGQNTFVLKKNDAQHGESQQKRLAERSAQMMGCPCVSQRFPVYPRHKKREDSGEECEETDEK